MTAVALPEPQALSAGEWASEARQMRQLLAEQRDLEGARELHDRLAVVRGYLAKKADDKSAVLALEAEERRTEVLIGELLGEAVIGRPKTISHDEKFAVSVAKDDRQRFRLLSAHADLVESLIAEGITKRAPILKRIKELEEAPTVAEPAQRDKTYAAVQERYERIREMAGDGHTSSQIAEELGYSQGGLWKIVGKLGIDIPADTAVGRAHRIDANRVVEQTVMELESQASSAMSLMNGRWGELDRGQIDGWVASLEQSLRTLRTFTKHVKEASRA